MVPKKYRSKEASRPLIIVRKATKQDVPTMLRNFNVVAREQVYLGSERVSSKAQKRIS